MVVYQVRSLNPPLHHFTETSWLLLQRLPIFLLDVKHLIFGIFLIGVYVFTPLLYALNLFYIVQVLTTFCLHNVIFFRRNFDYKVWVIVGNISCSILIINSKIDRKIILYIRHNVLASF